jgi:hypothetical protein
VDTSVRRCTRIILKNDVYRPTPVLEETMKPPAKLVKKQPKKNKEIKSPKQ